MTAARSPPAEADYVMIRGRRIVLDGLVNPRIYDDGFVNDLRAKFVTARPFSHLRLESLFDPTLLELVEEEFDLFDKGSWRAYNSRHEQTYRTRPGSWLGPASELYFSVVNSRHFVGFLSSITGVEELIVDQTLFGGGLHESRNGGKFEIHRDFERHVDTGLRNEMVLLTYLNKGWDRTWGGELELWDADAKQCVARIGPDFGVSMLMKTLPHSFHGYPAPLTMPNGRTRRSLGAYYYSNADNAESRRYGTTTMFAHAGIQYSLACSARWMAKRWTPPAIWDMARKIKRYLDSNARK